MAIKDNTTVEKLKLVLKMESILAETASLLNMASISEKVSSMNASILKQEFDSLVKNLEELRDSYHGKNEIPHGFFKDNNSDLASESFAIAGEEKKLIKEGGIEERTKNNRKEQRERVIIDLIKVKGNVSIKDISLSIKGCSEKTIQRKLISLIQTGIIKKTGQRRWSRYSLN